MDSRIPLLAIISIPKYFLTLSSPEKCFFSLRETPEVFFPPIYRHNKQPLTKVSCPLQDGRAQGTPPLYNISVRWGKGILPPRPCVLWQPITAYPATMERWLLHISKTDWLGGTGRRTPFKVFFLPIYRQNTWNSSSKGKPWGIP